MDFEQVRQAYTSNADLYISLMGTSDQVDPADLDFISRHLAHRPGPVLDLGCGPGHLTAYLRALGTDASGLDMVPEFIAHARSAHPTVDYRLGSLANLDVPDHSVAGILAWFSLIHLPPDDLPAVLAGFHRAMAPGAPLVAGFFHGDFSPFDHRVVTAYRWPVDAFSDQLKLAGFTELERTERPADGTHRPVAAIAASASASASAS
ncbi:class I SAM-dependent DNA methyltransferase [Actinoplanes sp. GCM10030250]|uniref:class I SAM-dependent DNA methyltransferase n=1 Tax=Actinoplanes sp. GCM10030250 TaxID=3273376 RepID=UPI003614BCEA